MSTTQKGSLFSALNSLAAEIQTEKMAAAKGWQEKAAGPTPSDPGGYAGASTHPSTSVDNGGQAATEGSRSAENEADLKTTQGAVGVNSAPDSRAGSQDDAQLNIGLHQSATGEDPSVEDDYKAGKDDPGSSSPARTDNNEIDGFKYASATIQHCYDLHTQLANGILADLANGQGNQLTKAALATAKPAAAVVPAAPVTPARPAGGVADMIEKAAAAVKAGHAPADAPAAGNADLQAGYDLAQVLGVEKRAAQAAVADMLEATINDAHIDAALLGGYYSQFMRKQAAGDGEDHSAAGDDTSGANDAEGMEGETSGGGGGGGDGAPAPGGDLGGLGELLGSGGGEPGGRAAPPAGGPPAGADPMGGGGGGDPMGGASEQEALTQLAAALIEMGVPLDELAAAGSQVGGAGGPPPGGPPPGGPPPGMGGPPPGEDPSMGAGMKLASAVKSLQRSGKFQFKEARDGTRERALRDQMKAYLQGLLSS